MSSLLKLSLEHHLRVLPFITFLLTSCQIRPLSSSSWLPSPSILIRQDVVEMHFYQCVEHVVLPVDLSCWKCQYVDLAFTLLESNLPWESLARGGVGCEKPRRKIFCRDICWIIAQQWLGQSWEQHDLKAPTMYDKFQHIICFQNTAGCPLSIGFQCKGFVRWLRVVMN